jgi:hypothetical protein
MLIGMGWAFMSCWTPLQVSKSGSHFSPYSILCACQVVDEVRQLRFVGDCADKPVSLTDWSFSSIFGRSIERYCPVAQESNVRIELPNEKSYTLSPEPTTVDGDIAVYDLVNSKLRSFCRPYED